MKASNATSASAKAPSRPTGRSSAPPTPIAEGFGLSGPSDPPDPAFNAYRQDLADWVLAGQVIAFHYAEPLDRVIGSATVLRAVARNDGEALLDLEAGDVFAMLDNSLGWAWGYAGPDGRVGYVRSDTISPKSPSPARPADRR